MTTFPIEILTDIGTDQGLDTYLYWTNMFVTSFETVSDLILVQRNSLSQLSLYPSKKILLWPYLSFEPKINYGCGYWSGTGGGLSKNLVKPIGAGGAHCAHTFSDGYFSSNFNCPPCAPALQLHPEPPTSLGVSLGLNNFRLFCPSLRKFVTICN